jgi:transcriptional regulator with XRE-family HTH domain
MLDYKKIGKRVKESRRLKNMTQAKLAELADMADASISRIETGAKKVSLESLAKISLVLSASLDFLAFGTGPNITQDK